MTADRFIFLLIKTLFRVILLVEVLKVIYTCGGVMRIAFFIGNLYQTYESAVLSTMNDLASRKGIRLDVFGNCSVPSGNYLHIQGIKSILMLPNLSQYDGIIVADDTIHRFNMNEELRERIRKEATCPVVSIRARVEDCHSVVTDNYAEMYDMTMHVIRHHGVRNIGFVTGDYTMDDAHERFEGFRKAMEEEGIAVDSEDVFYGNYWIDQGPAMAEFFTSRSKGLPGAILCSNDYMAISLADELAKCGIMVPSDVIITGCDNIMEGDSHIPAITSIDISVDELCKTTLNNLLDLIAGKEVPMVSTVKGTPVYKSSCGCVSIEDDIRRSFNRIRNELVFEKEKSRSCIYMETDFSGALNDEDCIKWAHQYISKQGLFDKAIFVLDNEVRAYMNEDKKLHLVQQGVSQNDLVSDATRKYLRGRTNLFLPIQCRNDIYGYIVLQLRKNEKNFIDERLEYLLISLGNTMERLRMYTRLFAVNDIMDLYLTDPLTGLYNRRGFERMLEDTFKKHDYLSPGLAVASIDIDGLKEINDTYGHQEGDRAIKTLAECIKNSIMDQEFAARMGGDEFEVVIGGKSLARMDEFTKVLLERVNLENRAYNGEYDISISIGIAPITDYHSIMDNMKMADERMYVEKRIHHQLSK